MYARQVTMQLKPNGQANFARAIETEILPLLRAQAGFKDEITFVTPDNTRAVAISLWEQKSHAEAYERTSYAKVLTALTAVVQGTPRVENYEVSNSTFHKLAGGLPV